MSGCTFPRLFCATRAAVVPGGRALVISMFVVGLAACQIGCARQGQVDVTTPLPSAAHTSLARQRPSSASSTMPSVGIILSRDSAELRKLSFSATSHIDTHAGSTVFHVFHSICTGSADGHCQAIHVFAGRGTKPIWRHLYVEILNLSVVPSGFAVDAQNYAPQDPLCCPSLPPTHEVYRWNGTRFTSSARGG